jgi:hypothetical protein
MFTFFEISSRLYYRTTKLSIATSFTGRIAAFLKYNESTPRQYQSKLNQFSQEMFAKYLLNSNDVL